MLRLKYHLTIHILDHPKETVDLLDQDHDLKKEQSENRQQHLGAARVAPTTIKRHRRLFPMTININIIVVNYRQVASALSYKRFWAKNESIHRVVLESIV